MEINHSFGAKPPFKFFAEQQKMDTVPVNLIIESLPEKDILYESLVCCYLMPFKSLFFRSTIMEQR